MESHDTHASPPRRPGWLLIIAVLMLAMVVTAAATLWVARTWLFPQPFAPVVLDTRERAALDNKLLSLAGTPSSPDPSSPDPSSPDPSSPDPSSPDPSPAHPDEQSHAPVGNGEARDTFPAPRHEADSRPPRGGPYVEHPQDRVIYFTQRELNAMIARNPDLAERLTLHLSDGMLSATMLVTLPADLPAFAGHTVRVSTGLRLRHEQGRAVFAIEGVSIMGVPLPAAWLGGLKGQDLIALYGAQGGFWQALGEGVRDVRIEAGRLRVELAQ